MTSNGEKNGNTANEMLAQFVEVCKPLEGTDKMLLLSDGKTGAHYCECHILGSTLIKLGTIDVPLDPEEQPEFRANRELEENSVVFQKMKEDAVQKRSFSNLVSEWKKQDADFLIQVIGGQHRFEAIRMALDSGIDVYHGIKVYFDLDMAQRLDVQLISNTNIDISGDLIDRLRETAKGKDLRTWCHNVGLLEKGKDFTDRYIRNGPISVRHATTFITNYYNGKQIDDKNFANVETTPMVYKSGGPDELWEKVKKAHVKLWEDAGLLHAAKEFTALVEAQRVFFENPKKTSRRSKPDYPEKALNLAVMSAWAFVAGVLHKNHTRLQRHFNLKTWTAHDPLNAAELATAKHWTDPPNYRGLGNRYDPQERGRFAELFFIQAEDGKGIRKTSIDLALKKYHAKQGQLDVKEAEARAKAD